VFAEEVLGVVGRWSVSHFQHLNNKKEKFTNISETKQLH
jgi:hypothetical protein